MSRLRLRFYNSIRIDGTVFAARGTRIVWGCGLPQWLITAYCTVAEWVDPSDEDRRDNPPAAAGTKGHDR